MFHFRNSSLPIAFLYNMHAIAVHILVSMHISHYRWVFLALTSHCVPQTNFL